MSVSFLAGRQLLSNGHEQHNNGSGDNMVMNDVTITAMENATIIK